MLPSAGPIEATTAHPASAIESGPLGLWGRGELQQGWELSTTSPRTDCHGMSLSRHSSLHLLGAHPPVNAVTAGRDGTCGRRRQGLLRPPSSVRLRGKRSVWATGCLCARPPSPSILSMPKSDRGRTRLGQLPETDVSTPSVARGPCVTQEPKRTSASILGETVSITTPYLQSNMERVSAPMETRPAVPSLERRFPSAPNFFLMRVDDALSASVPIESGTPLVQHLLAGWLCAVCFC